MIVITGAAGFIGSHLCRKLNFHGIKNIILVDDFTQELKRKNWKSLEYTDKIQREHFFDWAAQNVQHIDFIYHLGARTDYFSTENDIFEMLNVDYSQRVWSFAATKGIPLIYASSYFTNIIPHTSHLLPHTSHLLPHTSHLLPHTSHLSPLTSYLSPPATSLYAQSKYIFDKWIDKQAQTPPLWAGLKFFQVYGKNEAHKEENASVVYKIFQKYAENAPEICVEKNIIQDYIYVNDVTKVLYYFLNHAPQSGIYEVGTGFARSLHSIVEAMNKATKRTVKLILEHQNEDPFVSQANFAQLRKYAYKQAFLSLEQGIKAMVRG